MPNYRNQFKKNKERQIKEMNIDVESYLLINHIKKTKN